MKQLTKQKQIDFEWEDYQARIKEINKQKDTVKRKEVTVRSSVKSSEKFKLIELQIATANKIEISNKLVDDNDSTTSAISAQHLPKYAKPSGTWECSCATRGGIECYQDLIEQPEMDTKSGDSIHSAEDEITAISLEFVEMVFDMAQSKKKRKTFWVSKTSEKIKKLLDKELRKAYKAGEEKTREDTLDECIKIAWQIHENEGTEELESYNHALDLMVFKLEQLKNMLSAQKE